MKRKNEDDAADQSPAKKANVTEDDRCKAIIFCGAPGSGKGTQCDKLVAAFGFHHLSTGDLLRDAVKANTDLGKQAHDFMEEGQLVHSEIFLAKIADRGRCLMPLSLELCKSK